MSSYKAEDLVSGMVLKGARGLVTLGRKLPNRINKRGIEMIRFECERGAGAKTYSAAVGSRQFVMAVPANFKEPTK